MGFKEAHTFDKRESESRRIRAKYPDRIPVIVDAPTVLGLDKFKYLVPNDLTIGQFRHVLRNRMKKLKPDEATFLFCNNGVSASSNMMSQIYKENHDKDGFLYVKVGKESTFG